MVTTNQAASKSLPWFTNVPGILSRIDEQIPQAEATKTV